MKIEYSEYFGELKFTCERDRYRLSGTVPDSIISNGEAAINKYVTERMDRHIRQTKKENIKNKERAKRIKNTNVPICVKYANQTLRGRILNYQGSSDRGLITIFLDFPKKFKGDDSIFGCFGMAMAGIRVFDDDGNLTKWTLDKSKESLVEIYEGAKKRKIAKKLNKH